MENEEVSQEIEKQFSDDQIEQAEQEIEGLTPEMYLELMNQIACLEEQVHLPEAASSFNAKIYSKGGTEIQVTIRNANPTLGLQQMISTIGHAIQRYGMSARPPQTPSAPAPLSAPAKTPVTASPPANPALATPAPVPAQAQAGSYGETVSFQVSSVSHKVSDNGVHYVLVKGGQYSKFGVKAYDNFVPVGVDFLSWAIGQEFGPPDSMRYAVVQISEGKAKKVVAFSDKP
jgi:hypothetical protein